MLLLYILYLLDYMCSLVMDIRLRFLKHVFSLLCSWLVLCMPVMWSVFSWKKRTPVSIAAMSPCGLIFAEIELPKPVITGLWSHSNLEFKVTELTVVKLQSHIYKPNRIQVRWCRVLKLAVPVVWGASQRHGSPRVAVQSCLSNFSSET